MKRSPKKIILVTVDFKDGLCYVSFDTSKLTKSDKFEIEDVTFEVDNIVDMTNSVYKYIESVTGRSGYFHCTFNLL